jgi:hypothetical protein
MENGQDGVIKYKGFVHSTLCSLQALIMTIGIALLLSPRISSMKYM